MSNLNYKTKIFIPERAYRELYNFIARKGIKNVEGNWKGLTYDGIIYYLDRPDEQAVKVSSRRFFGLFPRKVELTDKIDSAFIDGLNKIKEEAKRK